METKEHHAVVGCFLRDITTNTIYGLTNRHVVLFATEGLFVKKEDDENILLGYPVHFENEDSLDFGLFEVVGDMKERVTNILPNVTERTKNCDVELYPGRPESLEGATVFKYRPKSDNSYIKLKQYRSPSDGKVLKTSEKTDRGKQRQFFVSGVGEPFSVRGESGTAVAITRENGPVQIVGIITGGSEENTLCLFLPFILNTFAENYGLHLELLKTDIEVDGHGYFRQVVEERLFFEAKPVPCGSTVYLYIRQDLTNSPEKISPLSIDLDDVTLTLLCCKFEKKMNLCDFSKILNLETELTRLINQRGTLDDNSIFENDKPVYVAMENLLKACDDIYQGNLKMAEIRFKTALKVIKPVDWISCRIFAKFITSLTWFKEEINTTKSLKEMKILLNEGLEYYHDNKDVEGFPEEVGAFLYYDFARYNLRKIENMVTDTDNTFDREKAKEKRKRALKFGEISVNKVDELQDETIKEELIIMKCDYASSLLGCGNNFNTAVFQISEEQLCTAERHLNDVMGKISKAPTVQKASYLLASCDLQFRKGYINKALKLATQCKALGTKEEEFVRKRAEIRINALRAYVQ